MKKNNENQIAKRAAFTIVELLTVMAVIAILIGLLVPALSLVHDTAKDLQQKAQFHGIEVGLEAYKTVYGSYPESDENHLVNSGVTNPAGDMYNGSNKLAEAMLGWDLLGFHPKSEFVSNGTEATTTTLVYDSTDSVNLDERTDRFVELEKANAYRIEDIYTDTTLGAVTPETFVLCDSYAKRRSVSGYKTGTPILYFKANTKYRLQDLGDTDGRLDDIYNYDDNAELLLLGSAEDGEEHLIADGVGDDYLEFEDLIINEQIEAATYDAVLGAGTRVPYLAEKYILMSAGKDGIFGNSDDIYNFEKEK